MLGLAHRQRVDVEPAPREAPGDAGQDARLVLHEYRQRVPAHQMSSSSKVGRTPRANMISSLLVPAATMGHTIAFLPTTKSTTTGPSLIFMAISIVLSTSAAVSHRSPV